MGVLPVMLAIAVFSPTPIAVAEEQPSRLERRVNELERLVQQLQDRIVLLEGRLGSPPAKPQQDAARGSPQGKASWRKIKKGMPMEEVRAILGEPDSVVSRSLLTFWYWHVSEGSDGSVVFSDNEKVFEWSEPR